jgi:cardiolipin synthase C
MRFLIDGAFNRLSQPIQAYLIEEGVEIKEYHPLRLTKPRWLTRRLHDKVLAIDQQQMLVGGGAQPGESVVWRCRKKLCKKGVCGS